MSEILVPISETPPAFIFSAEDYFGLNVKAIGTSDMLGSVYETA
jgi:hypothetical protein